MQEILSTKIAKEVARMLIEIKAVSFRFDPPFTFTSGIKAPIYLDNRWVMSYPKYREKIITYYLKAIKDVVGLERVEWISATATAAIPQGALVADRLKLPLVYVRPSSKSYGKGNKIEGYLKKGSKVLIIEDHISTAESAINNALTIREAGAKVNYCISTTTYETKKSQENFSRNKLTLITLTTGKVIIDTAYSLNEINLKQKELIDIWFEDPAGWVKNLKSAGDKDAPCQKI